MAQGGLTRTKKREKARRLILTGLAIAFAYHPLRLTKYRRHVMTTTTDGVEAF